MYNVVVVKSAAKELRKLNKDARMRIFAVLDTIANNPYSGEMLKGDLAKIFSYHVNVAGIEYRGNKGSGLDLLTYSRGLDMLEKETKMRQAGTDKRGRS